MSDDTDRAGYTRAMTAPSMTVRALNIDCFADGVVAHRVGKEFHENPHREHFESLWRLSWAMGWNERALQARDAPTIQAQEPPAEQPRDV